MLFKQTTYSYLTAVKSTSEVSSKEDLTDWGFSIPLREKSWKKVFGETISSLEVNDWKKKYNAKLTI